MKSIHVINVINGCDNDQHIKLLSYTLETILAEKLQTVLSRGLLNTRMRDYYDIRILLSIYDSEIDNDKRDPEKSF